jgi:hypothetical protein
MEEDKMEYEKIILSEGEPLSREMLKDYNRVYARLDIKNLSRTEEFFDHIENLGFNKTRIIKTKAGYLARFSRN